MLLSLQVKLPKRLAVEAKAKGLLTPTAVEKMLVAELKRGQCDRMFDAADRLAALNLPVLPAQEIEAEIKAVRSRRRPMNAGRR